MKSSPTLSLLLCFTTIVTASLSFTLVISTTPAEASGINCKNTPPVSTLPPPKQKAYLAQNGPDCFKHCFIDPCQNGPGFEQGLQGLEQAMNLAKQIKDLLGGGGGGGGGGGDTGGYDPYQEIDLGYDPNDALNDLYNDFGDFATSTNYADFFLPNRNSGNSSSSGNTSSNSSGGGSSFTNTGASPSAYFGNFSRTSGNSRDSGNSTERPSRPTVGASNGNTDGSLPVNSSSVVVGGGSIGSGDGLSSDDNQDEDDGIIYLSDDGPDRIIIGGANITGFSKPGSNGTIRTLGNSLGITFPSDQPEEENDFGLDESAYGPSIAWDVVNRDSALVRWLKQVGLLRTDGTNLTFSHWAWYLVTPAHGLGATAVSIVNNVLR